MLNLVQKRGEVTDVMIWMVTIFILAVGLFIIMYVTPSITQGLRTAGLNNSAAGANAIDDVESISISTINNGFMILFIGLVISVMLTSFLVRTHPIFLFLYIFFLAITILLAIYLGNVYYELQTNPTFSTTASQSTFINIVMNHIVEITLAVGALSMVIVFAKFSSGGSGGPQF